MPLPLQICPSCRSAIPSLNSSKSLSDDETPFNLEKVEGRSFKIVLLSGRRLFSNYTEIQSRSDKPTEIKIMSATSSSSFLSHSTILCSATARLLSLRRTVSIKPPSLVSPFFPSLSPSKSPAIKVQIRAARTESSGVSLGFRPPNFELTEPLTGKMWTLDEFESYPALLDGPEFMAEEAKFLNYPFPYLFDESQEVARAFGAVCTPEFFLFKKDGRRPFELFYHGQFDDSRPSNNVRVTGRDLSLAIDRVLSGQKPPALQKPSVGCSIKWHP